VLEAEGQAKAIQTVFNAIHAGKPDNLLLAYQYLQTLPRIAEGASNKLWFIPSEFTEALRGIGEGFATKGANPFGSFLPAPAADAGADAGQQTGEAGADASPAAPTDYSGLVDESAEAAVAEAEREAMRAEDAAPAGLPPMSSASDAADATSAGPSGAPAPRASQSSADAEGEAPARGTDGAAPADDTP
jgi:hypothetical protein